MNKNSTNRAATLRSLYWLFSSVHILRVFTSSRRQSAQLCYNQKICAENSAFSNFRIDFKPVRILLCILYEILLIS